MTKLKIKYYADSISRIPQEKAEIYGKELTKLIQQRGGQLTTEDVVSAARAKSSPLHSFFEWENKTAAHEYRKEQARYLLRHIKISVNESDEYNIRAFHSVTTTAEDNGKTQKVFVTAENAVKTEEYREQIITRLWATAESWSKRAKQFKEFAEITNIIDEKIAEKSISQSNQ